VFSEADHRWMAKALQLARRGLYSAAPNPRVGCVLVAEGGEVAGAGFHARTGGPHAEVEALGEAGARARGATAYLTLEPCGHHGRTPPCTDALLAAGVARVVAAMADPNPHVSGGGLGKLAQAGVATALGLMEPQARALNAGFVSRTSRGRPRVTIKLAASLDGRTALASGESRWITGEAARRDGHRLRAESCAILTGIGTALADDPRLDVRRDDLPLLGRRPLRVVLDGRLRLPPAARLFSAPGPVLVFTGEGQRPRAAALEAAGADEVEAPVADGLLDPAAVLAELARRECNEVLVEAGPRVAGAFASAGLADRLVIYFAPVSLGDAGRGMFHLPGLGRMADRLQWRTLDIRQIGHDLRVTVEPDHGPQEG
jgi:diaminohydroxyphosphoribosylaminopyrimidine deaminase/5-amino-6-(5-phosphoribosylamino)uracil reductase